MFWAAIIFLLLGILIGVLCKKASKAELASEYGSKSTAAAWRGGGSVSYVAGVALFILFFIFATFTIIAPGYVGIQVFFGKIQKIALQEGLNVKNPLASVRKMVVQTQSYTMSTLVDEGEKDDRPDAIRSLSKDNLAMDMDLTVLYSMVPSEAPQMLRHLGFTDVYTEKVVRPGIRTAIRNSASKYTAAELMGERRQEVERDIQAELEEIWHGFFLKRGIEDALTVERVMLRNVDPPATLKQAIENKLSEQQNRDAMEFTKQKAQLEAEKRVIEARGIAEAQAIIKRELSKEYLTWYYIETLKQLINSNNTTFVITPFDQSLIPMLNVK